MYVIFYLLLFLVYYYYSLVCNINLLLKFIIKTKIIMGLLYYAKYIYIYII